MRESPRLRRLRNDLKSLQQLKADSSIFDFRIVAGDPPEVYTLFFRGNGVWRPEGAGDVLLRDAHEVAIRLNAGYPRMMPELGWRSPIFHPNISAGGVVCLGGYGTYWTPSLNLDELCTMLWDMIRYENFDVNSPYNREAAHWAKTQHSFRLPVDERSIRDKVAGQPYVAATTPNVNHAADNHISANRGAGKNQHVASSVRGIAAALASASAVGSAGGSPSRNPFSNSSSDAEVMFLDSSPRNGQVAQRSGQVLTARIAPGQAVTAEVIDAEIVEPREADVLFIE
jgi:ubiquitin-protein ligase